MIITRKKKVPWSWVWMSQLPFSFWMITTCMEGSAFVLTLRKFSDNPALIFAVLGFARLPIVIIAPLVNYLSDRIWTRWGRRKPFYAISNIGCATCFCLMPLAPDFWSLTLLLWIYQTFNAFGKTIFVMAQDVIPVPQRGRGYAIRSLMFTLAILIYFGVVIGRFDDVYFIGPLTAFGQISGEKAVYWFAALLFFVPLLIVAFGIKEMPIPGALTLRGADGKRVSLLRFLKDFFVDVFEKRWLVLYLFLFGNALASMVVNSPIGPLLYTEQWGYSLQEFGGNVALGTLIMIPVVGVIGMLADRYSKMRLFAGSVAAATLLSAVYWVFVMFYLPDHRPALWQILVFGEFFAICGRIGETVLWPLLYEYIPRKRMGTAAAGMEMMQGVFQVILPPLIGVWIVFYSQFSLPHAGSEIRLVFNGPRSEPEVLRLLERAEANQDASPRAWKAKDVAVTPVNEPGESRKTSVVWDLRLQYNEATQLVKQQKQLESELSSVETNLKLKSTSKQSKVAEVILSILPTPTQEKCDELKAQLQATKDAIATRTKEFRTNIEQHLAPELFVEGTQLQIAKWTLGSEWHIPTTRVLTKDEVGVLNAGLQQRLPQIIAVISPDQSAHILNREKSQGIVLLLSESTSSSSLQPTLFAIRAAIAELVLQKDPPPSIGQRFSSLLSIASTMPTPEELRLGLSAAFANNAEPHVIPSIPVLKLGVTTVGSLKSDSASKVVQSLRSDPNRRVRIDPSAAPSGGFSVTSVFSVVPTAELSEAAPLVKPPGTPTPKASPEVVRRLTEATVGIDDVKWRTSAAIDLYEEVIRVAKDQRIIVPRPVLSEVSAEQKNDYFSVYLFSTAAGIVTLLIIWQFCALEKKGVITKLGVQEDLAESESTN